ncbi:MAG: DUF1207 domain-containing protein, partial [Planctomycetota bacterium]
FPVGGEWRGLFAPDELIYPTYVADPLRPTITFSRQWLSDTEIPDAGDSRYFFRFGTRRGFFRFEPDDDSGHAIQVDLYGAFVGVFDIDNSLDNIGWDGVYGVLATWTDGEGLAAQLGLKHDSSHVGDEYAERTGRKRIEYTRQEYVLGLSLSRFDHWRAYVEGGYAFDLRNDELQERKRLQGGLEFEHPDCLFGGAAGVYAAADITSYEELDWQKDVTVQAGLVLSRKGSRPRWRLSLEYRSGRAVIGEFFQRKEKWISLGLSLDL